MSPPLRFTPTTRGMVSSRSRVGSAIAARGITLYTSVYPSPVLPPTTSPSAPASQHARLFAQRPQVHVALARERGEHRRNDSAQPQRAHHLSLPRSAAGAGDQRALLSTPRRSVTSGSGLDRSHRSDP